MGSIICGMVTNVCQTVSHSLISYRLSAVGLQRQQIQERNADIPLVNNVGGRVVFSWVGRALGSVDRVGRSACAIVGETLDAQTTSTMSFQ